MKKFKLQRLSFKLMIIAKYLDLQKFTNICENLNCVVPVPFILRMGNSNVKWRNFLAYEKLYT